MSRSFITTYTIDGHKKRTNWKWHDGTLLVSADGRSLRLQSDDGAEVAAERLGPSHPLPDFSCGSEFKLSASVVVCIDQECGTQAPAGNQASAAAPNAGRAAPAPAPAQQQQQRQLASMVPPPHRSGLGRGGRFRAPRFMAPPAEHLPEQEQGPPPQQALKLLARGQQRALAQHAPLGAPALPARQREQEAPAASPAWMPNAAAAAQQQQQQWAPIQQQQQKQQKQETRTMEDVLQLFIMSGGAAAGGSAAAEPAEPAAKRQRTQLPQQQPAPQQPAQRRAAFADDDVELDLEDFPMAAGWAAQQQAVQSSLRHQQRPAPAGAPGGAGQSRWAQQQQQAEAPASAPAGASGAVTGPTAQSRWSQQQQQQQQLPPAHGAADHKPVVRPQLAVPLGSSVPGGKLAPGGTPPSVLSAQPLTRPAPLPPPRAPPAPAAESGGGGTWNAAVGGFVSLGWPSQAECTRLQRRVAIPDSFASTLLFTQLWCNALTEELNLKIGKLAQEFYSICARQAGAGGPPGTRPPARGARGRARPGGGAAALEAQLRQARLPYYGSCELVVWRAKKGGWAGKRRRRSGGDGEEEEEAAREGVAAKKDESMYLILKSGRQRGADYSKDDLWVISNTPEFRSGFVPGQLGDRNHAPWVAVVRSLWFGPNQDGKFEVEFITPAPLGLGRSQAVYALKGPEASTELGVMRLLQSGDLVTLPPALLGPLLGGGRRGPGGAPGGDAVGGASSGRAASPPGGALGASAGSEAPSPIGRGEGSPGSSGAGGGSGGSVAVADGSPAGGEAADQADTVIRRFSLNQEQAEVVRSVAAWCQPGGGGSPICLVHGPFGSGKSTLLVALLHFLLGQRKQHGSPLANARVLVAAHTNVAVDRMLLGLQESGVTSFLRLGPVRRIARALLPQSLHCSEGKAGMVEELKAMLADAGRAGDVREAVLIQRELSQAEKGAERQRRKLLKSVPIVGTTVCSAMLGTLDGQRFDMVEPLSLVPVQRGQCRFLIAAGDPKQLPPVIASPAEVSGAGGDSAIGGARGGPRGLLRPLFVRLADLGLPPFLLRRQYRCAPAISAVPNAHFYDGRLLDGVSAEQRASLLPGLPSLLFLHVAGQEVALVQRLLEAAMPQLHDLQQAAAAARRGLESKDSCADEAEGREEGGDEPAPAQAQAAGSVRVATVDSYQGAESDVIILTLAFTRATGFAADAARINVALTRARHNLVVLGLSQAVRDASPAFRAVLTQCMSTPGGYSNSGRLPEARPAALAPQPQGAQIGPAQPQGRREQPLAQVSQAPRLAQQQQQQQQQRVASLPPRAAGSTDSQPLWQLGGQQRLCQGRSDRNEQQGQERQQDAGSPDSWDSW
eukprot:scaffold6.g2672.t1